MRRAFWLVSTVLFFAAWLWPLAAGQLQQDVRSLTPSFRVFSAAPATRYELWSFSSPPKEWLLQQAQDDPFVKHQLHLDEWHHEFNSSVRTSNLMQRVPNEASSIAFWLRRWQIHMGRSEELEEKVVGDNTVYYTKKMWILTRRKLK